MQLLMWVWSAFEVSEGNTKLRATRSTVHLGLVGWLKAVNVFLLFTHRLVSSGSVSKGLAMSQRQYSNSRHPIVHVTGQLEDGLAGSLA